jgi:hypothetical protein
MTVVHRPLPCFVVAFHSNINKKKKQVPSPLSLAEKRAKKVGLDIPLKIMYTAISLWKRGRLKGSSLMSLPSTTAAAHAAGGRPANGKQDLLAAKLPGGLFHF